MIAARRALLVALALAWHGRAGAAEIVSAHLTPDGRSSEYVLVPPDGARAGESIGALVFFHADGGADDFTEWVSPELRAIAARHGLVLVSMKQPEGGCWWAPHARTDALAVADFLEHVLVARHGVDRRRIFFAGKSGGGFFATGLPFHAAGAFGGGVVGLCGGDVPRLDGGDCETETDAPAAPDGSPESHSNGSVSIFLASTADEYVDFSIDAAAWFAARGYDVTWRPLPGTAHCGFDLVAALAEALAAIDR